MKPSAISSSSLSAWSPRAARALASISATAVVSPAIRARSESSGSPSSSAKASVSMSASERTWRRSSAHNSGSRAIAC